MSLKHYVSIGTTVHETSSAIVQTLDLSLHRCTRIHALFRHYEESV